MERKLPCFAIKNQTPYLETNAFLKNKKNRKKANVYFQLKL